LDEWRRYGVEVVFLNKAIGQSPEDDLLACRFKALLPNTVEALEHQGCPALYSNLMPITIPN
jgi:hypothetical protein